LDKIDSEIWTTILRDDGDPQKRQGARSGCEIRHIEQTACFLRDELHRPLNCQFGTVQSCDLLVKHGSCPTPDGRQHERNDSKLGAGRLDVAGIEQELRASCLGIGIYPIIQSLQNDSDIGNASGQNEFSLQ
jgi:hypothetical protein